MCISRGSMFPVDVDILNVASSDTGSQLWESNSLSMGCKNNLPKYPSIAIDQR